MMALYEKNYLLNSYGSKRIFSLDVLEDLWTQVALIETIKINLDAQET